MIKGAQALSKYSSWIWAIVSIILGLCFIIFPDYAQTILVVGLAVFLGVIGIIQIITYFTNTPQLPGTNFTLASGLGLVAIAIVIACYPNSIMEFFVFLIGAVLFGGFLIKLQLGLDVYRLDGKGWWPFMIGALISLVLGIIILTTKGTIIFLGISLVIEGVLDGISIIIQKKIAKEKTV